MVINYFFNYVTVLRFEIYLLIFNDLIIFIDFICMIIINYYFFNFFLKDFLGVNNYLNNHFFHYDFIIDLNLYFMSNQVYILVQFFQ
jgi:hypothetical protein